MLTDFRTWNDLKNLEFDMTPRVRDFNEWHLFRRISKKFAKSETGGKQYLDSNLFDIEIGEDFYGLVYNKCNIIVAVHKKVCLY